MLWAPMMPIALVATDVFGLGTVAACSRCNSPFLFEDGLARRVDWVTAATPPDKVLAALLDALQAEDVPATFDLLSRARRMEIEELARSDMRATATPQRVHSTLLTDLTCNCPGLLGHEHAEVVASLGDPEPPRGRLAMWWYRLNVDGRKFAFQLSRQSKADPKGDPRDMDGFEECWFAWKIWLEDDRDTDGERNSPPLKGRLL